MSRLLSPLLLLFGLSAAAAEPLPPLTYFGETPRVQNPLSPELSARHVQLPEGFHAELFASEPAIVNPIAISWDAAGRLYVLQSVDYPHEINQKPGHDRITICEDTNGDGKADKFTVFAENLALATGMTCVDGGVVVAQMPNMVLWQDTDGDSRADKSTVLFTGFGLRDTHAGPSNLMVGVDGWLWGSVGYSGFKATFANSEQEINKGVYRFSRDGSLFEPVGQFNNNTWGVGLTEDNLVFGSTANNNHCIYVGIRAIYKPGKDLNVANIQGHYEIKSVCADPLQQVDVRGGYTAAAGARIYTGRAWPESYWDKAMFVCEPTGHIVHLATLKKDGAGYVEVDGGNIFASTDNWCAPVAAEVGPDGQVWIADWYNPVIQHNPDKRGMPNQIWNADVGPGNAHLNPLRDKEHGRIYRLVYDGAPATPAPNLAGADTAKLVATLRHPTLLWRTTAQEILVNRKMTDAIPALRALVADTSVDTIGMNVGAVHALWTLKALGALETGADLASLQAAYAALSHPAAGVRRAAAELLPTAIDTSNATAAARIYGDADLHTRLAAVLRASQLPKTAALDAALTKAAHRADNDKWLAEAFRLAGHGVAPAEGGVEVATIGPPKWKYTTTKPADNWSTPDFDDSAWEKGAPGFGTDGTPNAKIGTRWDTANIWIRRTAGIAGDLADLKLRLHHDEDYELYANGIPISAGKGFSTDYETTDLDAKAIAALKPKGNLFALHCRQTRGGQYINFEIIRPVRAETPAVLTPADLVIQLKTVPDKMSYDQKLLQVKAGQIVDIVLTNADHMPHNFVVIRPGKLETFGPLVDAFMTNPNAVKMSYVPASPDILASSSMLEPGATETIRFTVPEQTGDYPFVCTFPGHWRMMNGTMTVSPDIESGPRIVITGGGSSHNFGKFWGEVDPATLRAGLKARTTYTEDTDTVAPQLATADILLISNNKPFSPAWREAIFSHVKSGHGLIISHPGIWYNWRDWPAYNLELVAGGATGHEKFAAFDVVVSNPDHPIMQGVPATFEITDELYRWERDPKGPEVEVLAIGRSKVTGKEYPVLWVVKNPDARIVCNTLGHDEQAHDLPAYRKILCNSVKWAAHK